MEKRDSFEEEEATIAAVSRNNNKYEALSLKVALQKDSEGTYSLFAASKKYDIPGKMVSWQLKKQQNGEGLKKTGPENM